MDIVFIHGNFPAQFRHLAAALVSNGMHRVIFLTARKDADIQLIKGIEIRHFVQHRQPSQTAHHYLTATEEAILKGQSVLRALDEMKREGIKPRLVITHGGTGLGLFVKDLLPETLHIGLFEWYFKPETAKWLLPNFDFDKKLIARMRNLPIIDELNNCDVGVVPTNWQKQQFPEIYQGKLKTIFDGIDRSFFNKDCQIDEKIITLKGEEMDYPIELNPQTPVLSYATRGMETLRGFPEFMIAAAKSVEAIPNLQVIIAGKDRRAYSYDAPNKTGSWKEMMIKELGDFEGKNRILFTGLLPYVQYKRLLQRSNLHCYFTRPYVTSWSLFEAAACGARLCINRCDATAGIIKETNAVTWVNLDDTQQLTKIIISRLLREEKGPRSELKKEFELPESMMNWQTLINNLISYRT